MTLWRTRDTLLRWSLTERHMDGKEDVLSRPKGCLYGIEKYPTQGRRLR